MPIGKNAIKRVSSSASGPASDVKDTKVAEVKIADTVVEAPKEEAPKAEAPVVEETPAKEAPKKTAKKSTKKAVKAEKKQGFEHLAIGDDLPYYLL